MRLLLIALLTSFLALPAALAQEQPKPATSDCPDAAREAALIAALEEASFIGTWNAIAGDKLAPEKGDSYSVAGIAKVEGDRWIIRARLSPDYPDLLLPIPLRVSWADDTPLLIVEDFALPGGTPYSARVLIHRDTYAGTWYGGDKAGLISGILRRPE
jgi:hypothetical protein